MEGGELTALVVGAMLTFVSGFAAQWVVTYLMQRAAQAERRAEFRRQALLAPERTAGEVERVASRIATEGTFRQIDLGEATISALTEEFQSATDRGRILISRIGDQELTDLWRRLEESSTRDISGAVRAKRGDIPVLEGRQATKALPGRISQVLADLL